MATERSAVTVKPAKDRVKPTAAPTRTGGPGGASSTGPMPRAKKYLLEVLVEMRKTTWPTRQELISQTQVVLGLLVVIGVFIAVWNFILGEIVRGIMWMLHIQT